MRAGAQIPNVGIVEAGSLGTRDLMVLRERRPTKLLLVHQRFSVSHEEIDLVLCTMDDFIIEQLYEESISLSNEVAAGMQDKHPAK